MIVPCMQNFNQMFQVKQWPCFVLIHTRVILLDCLTPMRTWMKLQVNIISGYWDISMKLPCMQTISKTRAIICIICWIELSNMVVYIGVMVGKGSIKFQCNASSSIWTPNIAACKTLTKLWKHLGKNTDNLYKSKKGYNFQ